jgi:CHAT domain-containing protein
MSRERLPISYAKGLINLSKLHFRIKEYDKSEIAFWDAIKILEKKVRRDHIYISNTFHAFSKLCKSIGRFDKAYYLSGRSLVNDSELIRQIISATSEDQKIRFLNAYNSFFFNFIDLILKVDPKDKTHKKFAFDTWLKRKGIVLEILRIIHRNSLYDNSEINNYMFKKMNEINLKISNLTYTELSKMNIEKYNIIDNLNSDKEFAEKVFNNLNGEFLNKQYFDKISCNNVLKQLPDESILVDFAKIKTDEVNPDNGEKFSDKYVAFILQHDKNIDATIVNIGNADHIDQLIIDFKNEFSKNEDGISRNGRIISKELFNLIVKPILKYFVGVKTIFLSPDGNLNLLPFEILQKPDGKFLIEDYTFNYLSAGRDLLGFENNHTSRGKYLLMGAPDFDWAPPSIGNIVNTENGTLQANRSADLGELSFLPLHHAKAELESIGKIMGIDQSEIHIGKDALEETLLNADHPAIIHLATHGFFLSDQELPGTGRGFQMAELASLADFSHSQVKGKINIENPLLRSGILLAGAKRSLTEGSNGYHDGIVTAEEILAMNLHGTEMVVLSACDTGLGEVKSGEGVFGLRRAFTQSGAKSLVMSLWKVPDKETKELMVQFYRNIKSGKMNRCHALRDAILKEKEIVRKRYGHDDPRYWGAFVFMGQP